MEIKFISQTDDAPVVIQTWMLTCEKTDTIKQELMEQVDKLKISI